MTFTAGGSYTIVGATTSNTDAVPLGGFWDNGYDNELGEVLNHTDGSVNDDLIFSSNVTFSHDDGGLTEIGQ